MRQTGLQMGETAADAAAQSRVVTARGTPSKPLLHRLDGRHFEPRADEPSQRLRGRNGHLQVARPDRRSRGRGPGMRLAAHGRCHQDSADHVTPGFALSRVGFAMLIPPEVLGVHAGLRLAQRLQ